METDAPCALQTDVLEELSETASSDQPETEHDCIIEFIKTYEVLPELWNATHIHYTNKHKRNVALDELLRILQKMKPGATRDDVRKKLNSMRSNYRRELKKVIASEESDVEVYTPSSRTFYALQFLNTVRQPTQVHEADSTPPTRRAPKAERAMSPIAPRPSRAIKKKAVATVAKQHELNSRSSTNVQHEMPIVSVWAQKLANLDPIQRLYAEKGINDVLFEAELGNLNRFSVQINNPSKKSSDSP